MTTAYETKKQELGICRLFQLRYIIRTLGPVGTINRLGVSWTVLASCIAKQVIRPEYKNSIERRIAELWAAMPDTPAQTELPNIEQGNKHQPTLPGRQTAPNTMAKRVRRLIQERGVYAACRDLGVSWTVLLSVASNSDVSIPHLIKISNALETIWPTIASKEECLNTSRQTIKSK